LARHEDRPTVDIFCSDRGADCLPHRSLRPHPYPGRPSNCAGLCTSPLMVMPNFPVFLAIPLRWKALDQIKLLSKIRLFLIEH
jgi:hypothetical protein